MNTIRPPPPVGSGRAAGVHVRVSRAYYNEIDRNAAAWLRELIARGLIADGDVDERSITEVTPNDLAGYTQCHFFAGIGGWSLALRLAGIPDDRPVWTGSCPCQPFSAAGQRRGSDDERHLWPAFHALIRECRPASVFGEQVAGAAGLAWLDHVFADLEESGYAAAAADMPACSVGAPHRRQRLFWVANAYGRHAGEGNRAGGEGRGGPAIGGGMGDADSAGWPQQPRQWDESTRPPAPSLSDPWSDIDWLACTDGKHRPTQRGLSPLVAGLSGRVVRGGDPGAPVDADSSQEARVMRLRGYGNAIVPQVAAAFVRACMFRTEEAV